jgi:hypothetical protein
VNEAHVFECDNEDETLKVSAIPAHGALLLMPPFTFHKSCLMWREFINDINGVPAKKHDCFQIERNTAWHSDK